MTKRPMKYRFRHWIEPPADLRDQGAPARRHQPEQPTRHAFAADQEIAEQNDGQERADESGKTKTRDEHEPVRPAEPTMDAVADGAGDAVQVERSPEYPNGLSVGGAVQQMIKRSLKVGHRAADLGDKMPSGNGDGESCETDQQQEQQDRDQWARQAGSPGKPIQQRRTDISDDAGDHERQHNESDEIDEQRQRDEGHDDGTDLGCFAQCRGADAVGAFVPFRIGGVCHQFGPCAAPDRDGHAGENYTEMAGPQIGRVGRQTGRSIRCKLFVRLRQIGHCIVGQPLPVAFAALRRLDNALGHDFLRHPLVARRCQRTAGFLDRRPGAFKCRRQDIDDFGFEGRLGQQWDYCHDRSPQYPVCRIVSTRHK